MKKAEALASYAADHGLDPAEMNRAVYSNQPQADAEKAKARARAEALRPLFEPRAGWSAYRLAKWLNQSGIASPRGMKWSPKTVIRVRGRLT